MDSLTVTLKDKEQLECISKFVNSIADIYKRSSVTTIYELAGRLADMCAAEKDTPVSKPVNLVFDKGPELHTDLLYCLYIMCEVPNNIGAEEINACADAYKVLKKHYTKSNVPWFLTVLEDNHVPAEYCVELFSSWCSCECNAVIAEKCMNIQTKYNIDMTAVWKQLSNNKPFPDTYWVEEIYRYKEAIK